MPGHGLWQGLHWVVPASAWQPGVDVVNGEVACSGLDAVDARRNLSMIKTNELIMSRNAALQPQFLIRFALC